MFIVLLKFTDKRDQADAYMEGHKAWLKRGFDEGVFLLAGGLEAKAGGGLLIHGTTRDELDVRISTDPFVAEKIVIAEIIELTPSKAVAALEFLLTK